MGQRLTKKAIAKSKKSPKPRKQASKTVKPPSSTKATKPKKVVEWTPAKRHSFIVSVLRAGTRRWPAKYEALAEAYVGQKINVKTGRLCKHYRCAIKGEDFPSSEVSVDHIEPVITKEGFTTWDSFINRLFCGKENLQVLSKEAHDKKTKQEREERQHTQNRLSKMSEEFAKDIKKARVAYLQKVGNLDVYDEVDKLYEEK